MDVDAKSCNGDTARSLALIHGHTKIVSLIDNHIMGHSHPLRSEPGRSTNISIMCVSFTTHKRSLGQGNVFTPVCHSVHNSGVSASGSRGDVSASGWLGGVCLWVWEVTLPLNTAPTQKRWPVKWAVRILQECNLV